MSYIFGFDIRMYMILGKFRLRLPLASYGLRVLISESTY